MDTLKISYTIWKKHGNNLYCRVRQAGVKPLDINLHTTDNVVAETFVKLRRSELELYNRYVLAGEAVPEDVANKLLRRGSSVAEKSRGIPAVTTMKAMEEWELHLRRIGKREATISSYLKNVRLTLPSDDPVSAYTSRYLQNCIAKHDHLKPASRKMYSVCTREFCKFCISEYGLDSRIIDNWQFVKVDTVEKPAWTMQQMYKIIENVKCVDKECEEQFKAYLWILATCGSRQGETGELRWADLSGNVLTFRAETTKSGKTRKVPLDMRIADMLRRLPHKGAKIFPDIPPSQPGRFAILSKAVKRAEVPHGGLHTFRHSCARILYKKCNDIKAVATMLGHSPEISLLYYQSARQADELRSVVDSAFNEEILLPSPIDSLIESGLM